MPALRVLVIDNSIFAQDKIVKAIIERLPQGSLLERSSDAGDAVDKVRLFRPNVVALNFSMAVIRVEGEMLISHLSGYFKLPVIAFGKSSSSRNAAVRRGALEYYLMPADQPALDEFYDSLVQKMQEAVNSGKSETSVDSDRMGSGEIVTREIWKASKPRVATPAPSSTPAAPTPAVARPSSFILNHQQPMHATTDGPATIRKTLPPQYKGGPVELIAIGSSTGGTEALSVVLHSLRPPLPPIVIVQHIPAMFSRLLAKRLDEECALSIKEAATGDYVQKNHVYIAPGGKHMTIAKAAGNGFVLDCTPGKPVHSCCPSVDVLFDTVASFVGDKALGVILTGMGRDGASGLSHMREMGAYTLGQDEASCVVYGMPKAAYEEGAVCEQLPLNHIAAAITRIANSHS